MPRFSRAVALIGVLLLAQPAVAQRLRLVADAWPPFTDSTLINGGLATDIVSTALAGRQWPDNSSSSMSLHCRLHKELSGARTE